MDINFNKNEDRNKLLLSELKKRLARVKLGGGQTRIEKQHELGKLSARERIDYLLDDKSNSIEIAAFAGDNMYKEHGGCPSGGVVVKIGYLVPELYDMRADWVMALTPGGVDQDLERLGYKRINRPMFPLDADMNDPDLKAKLVPLSDEL